MSGADLMIAKSRILQIFQDFDDAELEEIENWIATKEYKNDLEKLHNLNSIEDTLNDISNSIKKRVPFTAEMPTEKINMPTIGEDSDCTKENTIHIDAFLYNDDETDKLVKDGKLKRHYCLDCLSSNKQDYIFISHSLSKKVLQYCFNVILPKDLDGKQILDVGSRLGSILYGAYYMSTASSIVGVELNKECCEVQQNIIKEFALDQQKVKVVHSDIIDCAKLVKESDIIFVNVLDFFVEIEKHREIWNFLKKNIKKGSYLLTNKSLTDTLECLNILSEFIDWFSICKPFQLQNEILFDIEDIDCELFLYAIK